MSYLNSDTITVQQGVDLTGLPHFVIRALAECERIPSEIGADGQLHVVQAALLNWCNIYAEILRCVTQRQLTLPGGHSAFERVWLFQNGLVENRRG